MEHWRVRGIEFVGSESFTRSKNVGWCTTLQHRADLYRRRVSPQQQMGVSRFNKKGVLHFSSWMVWFKVQRVKVVPFGFQFRTFSDFPPHSDKNKIGRASCRER